MGDFERVDDVDAYAYPRTVFTELPKAQSSAEVEALLPTRLDPRQSVIR